MDVYEVMSQPSLCDLKEDVTEVLMTSLARMGADDPQQPFTTHSREEMC